MRFQGTKGTRVKTRQDAFMTWILRSVVGDKDWGPGRILEGSTLSSRYY